jgi:hypothetical protein
LKERVKRLPYRRNQCHTDSIDKANFLLTPMLEYVSFAVAIVMAALYNYDRGLIFLISFPLSIKGQKIGFSCSNRLTERDYTNSLI